MNGKKWCVMLISALSLVPLFGQEAPALTKQLVYCWDVRLGNADENRRSTEVIARSALVSFEQIGYKAVPAGELSTIVPERDLTKPVEQTVLPKLIELARAQSSSFAVIISYYADEAGVVLEVRAWDLSGKRFFEAKNRARSSLELYNRLNDAVTELAANAAKRTAVVTELPEGAETLESKGYVQQIIVLSGDEGAEIYLNGVTRLGAISSGRLALPFMPLNLGAKLSIEKRRAGYYNDIEEFTLDEEWIELPLRPMEKIVTHEGLFIYTVGQFVGFGLGYQYYLMPRKLSLGVENYFYLQTSDVQGSRSVLHDDIRFLAGFYIISLPGAAIKVGLSTGLGCILTLFLIPPNPLFADVYFNLLNIYVEFRVWEITFFVREEIKMGVPIFNNLLGGGFYMIRGEIPIFSFGVKLSL